MDQSRTLALIGSEASEKLKNSVVCVVGIGGVGSFAAEALARSGVGTLVLIDNDVVKPSNCNRQLVALSSTIGQYKTQVMKQRILDINTDCNVMTFETFYNEQTPITSFAPQIDYVIDAIDSLPSKLRLILECKQSGIPIVSAMGAGNKLYPERFQVIDIFKTKYDPIAKKLRSNLKKAGVKKLTVVCSDEQPVQTNASEDGKRVPASISFVPSVCGLLLAGAAIRDMTKTEGQK